MESDGARRKSKVRKSAKKREMTDGSKAKERIEDDRERCPRVPNNNPPRSELEENGSNNHND